MPHLWIWLVVVLFLVTPMVAGKLSTAGSPDLWMAFGAALCVLIISKARGLRPNAACCADGTAGRGG